MRGSSGGGVARRPTRGSGRSATGCGEVRCTACSGPSWPPRVLVVTTDGALLDDLLRLAAAAGVEVDVAPDLVAMRALAHQAPLVLVGDDQARSPAGSLGAGAGPCRDIVVVSRDLDDAGVWRRAMGVGAGHVAVLPDSEAWLLARMVDVVEGQPAAALTVGVIGGRGGAGASTLAAALAVTANLGGRRTILVDADPYGGGADLIFGGEQIAGLRWPDLAGVDGQLNARELREALPRVGELAVLSWDRGELREVGPATVRGVLAAAARAADLVVIDIPRTFEPAAQAALAACDLVLLVVPAEFRAAAAAGRIAAQVCSLAADVRVVVRGPAPGHLQAEEVAAALRLPLAGELRPEPALALALERGQPPGGRGDGPLVGFCRRFLADVDAAAAA